MKSARMNAYIAKALVVIGGAAVLSACTSIGYRCPLDPNEKPEHPTACANMQDAMAGAKMGSGGKTSVLLDDKGRMIPKEMIAANPGKFPAAQVDAPYRDKTGNPIFNQSKVYQVWSESFQDAQGNLHDGHHAWFATPGRWAYGSVDQPTAAGQNVMAPARPDQLNLPGRIVPDQRAREAQRPAQSSVPVSAAQTAQERDRAALQNLSNAARAIDSQPRNNPPATVITSGSGGAAGTAVTAPSVMLGN